MSIHAYVHARTVCSYMGSSWPPPALLAWMVMEETIDKESTVILGLAGLDNSDYGLMQDHGDMVDLMKKSKIVIMTRLFWFSGQSTQYSASQSLAAVPLWKAAVLAI